MVVFLAPWCGISKNFITELSSDPSTVNFPIQLVNAVAEQELYDLYNIEAFPTAFIFEHGIKSDVYVARSNQDFTVNKLQSFYHQSGSLNSVSTLDQTWFTDSAATTTTPLFCGYFPNAEDGYPSFKLKSEEAKADFHRIAKSYALQHVQFVQLTTVQQVKHLIRKNNRTDAALASLFAVRVFPSYFLLLPQSWLDGDQENTTPPHDPQKHAGTLFDQLLAHTRVLQPPTDVAVTPGAGLIQWISKHAWPSIVPYTPANKELYLRNTKRPGYSKHLLFFANRITTKHDYRRLMGKICDLDRWKGLFVCAVVALDDRSKFRSMNLVEVEVPSTALNSEYWEDPSEGVEGVEETAEEVIELRLVVSGKKGLVRYGMTHVVAQEESEKDIEERLMKWLEDLQSGEIKKM